MKVSSYIGIDLGTTNLKVSLVDAKGIILVEKHQEYSVHYPRQGWAEQDPEKWVIVAERLLAEVCHCLPNNCRVESVCVSGQMHGLVVLDADLQVLRPAILWNDQRSKSECDEITKAVGGLDRLLDLTNNAMQPGYTFPKIIWLRKYEPDVFDQITHVLLPKDYLRFRLCGHLGTDFTDASGTGCFDVENRVWAGALLEEMGVPLSWFPQVCPSNAVVGKMAGLLDGVSVVAGAGDAALQPLAGGVESRNDALLVIGTGGNVTVRANGFSRNEGGRVQFFCDVLDDQYLAMGVTLSAGESMRWIRNLLSEGMNALKSSNREIGFDDLSRLAQDSPAGARGVLFTPYLQGERCPHSDPDLRASFTGLSIASSLADMTRAVMEGVAFSLKDVSLVLESLGISIDRYHLMGGGGGSKLWRDILCNVLNRPIRVGGSSTGGTAYGSALLAKLGHDGRGWESLGRESSDVVELSVDAEQQRLYAERFEQYRTLR